MQVSGGLLEQQLDGDELQDGGFDVFGGDRLVQGARLGFVDPYDKQCEGQLRGGNEPLQAYGQVFIGAGGY